MQSRKDLRWVKGADIPFELNGEGVERKILAYNKDLMTVENHFKQGGIGPMHSHPHTQMTYVLSGKFCFNIDGEMRIVEQGDVMLKTDGVEHGCVCIEEGSLLDIFTPMREDFVDDEPEEVPVDETEEETEAEPEEFVEETKDKEIKVAVIGVGGAGLCMITRMSEAGLPLYETIAVDTDTDDLEKAVADYKIAIKDGIEETLEKVGSLIKDTDIVFIAAGMGGNTGTHAAPLIADLAKELGIMNVAFVANPFMFEGSPKVNAALQGINSISKYVSALVVLDNNKLLENFDRNLPMPEMMAKADAPFIKVLTIVSYLAADPETKEINMEDIREILEIFVIGDECNEKITEVYY